MLAVVNYECNMQQLKPFTVERFSAGINENAGEIERAEDNARERGSKHSLSRASLRRTVSAGRDSEGCF